MIKLFHINECIINIFHFTTIIIICNKCISYCIPDRAALDEYLENEPYVAEGVWQRIEVEQMNVVLLNGERV